MMKKTRRATCLAARTAPLLALGLLLGCSTARYQERADKAAYDIITHKQKAALDSTTPFTIAQEPWDPLAELPRRLFEQGRARILNDNPEVCAGVMQDGARPLIILVNLTNREQSCRIRSKDGERQVKLAAYAVSLER